MGPAALWLLLPGALLGLCSGAGAGWEESAWGGRRAPPWELLDAQLEPECRELLAAFANSSAALTGCLARSARPVRLCQNCYRQFRDAAERYEDIAGAVGNATKSNPCAKSLLRSDRLQIVVVLDKFFNDTWQKANCASCLKNNSEGLSNSTEMFLALFNESLACFEHNLQPQEDNEPPGNYTEVCKKCNVTYEKLNTMYNMMQESEKKGESEEQAYLCIDVEDAMNITRRLWSMTFNCSVPCSDTVPVIAVSSFILFLPVVFYLSSFLHSKQKKRILFLPKRIQSNANVNIQDKSN